MPSAVRFLPAMFWAKALYHMGPGQHPTRHRRGARRRGGSALAVQDQKSSSLHARRCFATRMLKIDLIEQGQRIARADMPLRSRGEKFQKFEPGQRAALVFPARGQAVGLAPKSSWVEAHQLTLATEPSVIAQDSESRCRTLGLQDGRLRGPPAPGPRPSRKAPDLILGDARQVWGCSGFTIRVEERAVQGDGQDYRHGSGQAQHRPAIGIEPLPARISSGPAPPAIAEKLRPPPRDGGHPGRP